MSNKYSIGIAMVIFLVPLVSSETNNVSNETESISEENIPITYKVDVDQDYGFYRVIDYTTHKPSPYANYTLTINIGDMVEWINDATPDEPLTIISKEGLWENRSAYLRWNYQRFSYTFNQSGTYEVYIKEYPREEHQIIKVNPLSIITTPRVTETEILSITPTTPIETKTSIKKDYAILWVYIVVAGLMIIYATYKLRS